MPSRIDSMDNNRPPPEDIAEFLDRPVEIAERIWWVGHILADDPFQCHVYLIENGDQSLLIDPGSVLTFKHTLLKIEQVIPFSSIRYFICQHQDPDITGCLPIIDRMIDRTDAVILTHSRAIALLKHLDLALPFNCVEKAGWRLDLGGRELEFIFTPYLHFPGAFCTFDRRTGTLFSSDLFGGYTEKWQLFAQDIDYFDAIRPFHEHYMPSKDILFHALCKIEKFPLELIAPQHGSIIPKRLIPLIIGKLKTIDCGIYLLAHSDTDVRRLSRLNAIVHALLLAMATYREFKEIVNTCHTQIRQILPVDQVDFLARQNDDSLLCLTGTARNFSPGDKLPPELIDIFTHNRHTLISFPNRDISCPGPQADPLASFSPGEDTSPLPFANCLIIPLVESGGQRVIGIAALQCSGDIAIDEETEGLLLMLVGPLSLAVERELIYRGLEYDRQRFYEQSIRDPLTHLYNRNYMHESVRRLLSIHDRNPTAAVGIVSCDIDYFKKVNDIYGHQAGDEVLKEFAAILIQETRAEDIQVRLGGEEFAVFIVNDSHHVVIEIAERIRHRFNRLQLGGAMQGYRFSVSCGAVVRHQREPLQTALQRADDALYKAKREGRNRVCSD